MGLTIPKNKKLTWKLVVVEVQPLQILQVSEGLGDAPYNRREQKIGENQVVSGDWPPRKIKKLTSEFIGVQIQFLQVFQIPEGLRDAPYRERGQKNSEIQMVSGDWPAQKWKKN